jgi:hypothetical protein
LYRQGFIFGFYCFSRLAQISLSAARWRCSRAFRALIIANEFLERDFGKLLARKQTDVFDWNQSPQIFHAASGSEKY